MELLEKEIDVGYVIEMIKGGRHCNESYIGTIGRVTGIRIVNKVHEVKVDIMSCPRNMTGIVEFGIYDDGWNFKIISSNDWDI